VAQAPTVAAAEREARVAAPALAARATATLHALGRPYAAHVVVGDAYFPAKRQGSLRLGPGVYAAATVVLGRGQGQNWWCVLFPDMCLANPLDSLTQSEPASGREVLLAGTGGAHRPATGLPAVLRAIWSWL
jgi:stage II sporulation protein R